MFEFVKNILTELHSLNNSLQEHTSAISDATQTAKSNENKSPEVRAILNFPDSIQADKKAADERTKRYQNRNLLVGWITLGTIIAYAITTIFIYCANNRAANAARDAANVARDTLIASNRSWVGQSGPVTLEFSDTKGDQYPARINLMLENFGHSPAVSVFASANLVPNEELTQAAELTCKETMGMRFAKSKHRLTGQTIFPSQKWGLGIDDGPIKSRDIVLYVVGCITYRDDITDGIWWTRFCQETPKNAYFYKSGQPLVTCNVYNETGEYEKGQNPN